MAPNSSQEPSNSSTNPPLERPAAPDGRPSPPFSESSDDNPFIQFRCYADSQISSLLQSVIGLPSLFQQPPPNTRWIIIDQDAAMRHQQELEMDRALREPAAVAADGEKKQESWKAKEQVVTRQWTAATAVDNNQTPSGQVQQAQGGTGDEKEKKWYSPLGWDGKQRCRKGTGSPDDSSDKDEDIRYRSSKSLDPFTNANDTVPWLLTDPYSPLVLSGCMRFHIDGFKAVNGSVRDDNSTLAFVPPPHAKVLEPHYSSPRIWYPYQRTMRHQVKWGDAFEDLIRLQNTGQMVNREYSPRRMDMTWLRDVVDRGSLGRRWVSLELPSSISSKLLFQNLETGEYIIGSKSRRFWGLRQMLQRTRSWDDRIANLGPEDHPNVVAPQGTLVGEPSSSDGKHAAEVDTTPNLISSAKPGPTEPSTTSEPDWSSSFQRPEDIIRAIEQQFGRFPRDAEFMEEMMKRTSEFLSSPNGVEDFVRDLIKHWPTPDEVAEALRAASASQAKDEGEEPGPETKEPEPEPLNPSGPDSESESTTYFTSSSSASSYSSSPEENGRTDSIISTLTTTQRRTLPDGTIETKRVLKKRFSDGTEESSESVERQMGSGGGSLTSTANEPKAVNGLKHDAQHSRDLSNSDYRDQGTSTEESMVQKKAEKEKKNGGWFWN